MTKTTQENLKKPTRNSGLKRVVRKLIKNHYEKSDTDSTKSKVYKRAENKKNRTIILLTLAVLLIVMMFTPVFNIKEIAVSGNVRVDTQTAVKVSGVVVGNNIFRINKIRANTQLEKIPFVDNVKIKRHLPSKVEIILKENTECAFIKFMGNYIGIDMNGKILEVLQSNEGITLPIITGVSLKSFEAGKKTGFTDKKDGELVFSVLEHLENNELIPEVKAINIKKDGKLQLTLVNGTVAELGDESKLKYKTAYLKAIIAELGDATGGIIELGDTENVSYRGSSE